MPTTTTEDREQHKGNYFKFLASQPELNSNSVEDVFSLFPTVCLTPVLIASGIYKVIETTPRATHTPSSKVSYTWIAPKKLKKEYYLIPEANPGSEDLSLRPLAVYSGRLSYHGKATIYDLTSIDTPHDRQKQWDITKPSKITLSMSGHKRSDDKEIFPTNSWGLPLPDMSSRNMIVEFRVNQEYSYRWKKFEYPSGSGCYRFYLHRQTGDTGYKLPVARVVPSSFRSPVDGHRGHTIEIDSTKVHAILAYTSFCAIESRRTTMRINFKSASSTTDLPVPEILTDAAFADNPQEPIIDEDKDEDSDDIDLEDEDFSSDAENRSMQIRVFDSAKLARYQVPETALARINYEQENYNNSIRKEYEA